MTQVQDGSPAFAGLTPGEGSSYWTLGMLMVVKAWGRDTAGRLSACEFVCPPGYATPLHLHHREDETWWVLEGQVRYRCDADEFVAGPGAFVYLPRGLRHGFKVTGPGNARMLHVAVPSGMEEFHAELGEPATELTVPPPAPVDVPRVIEVGARYGIEVVGPPID